MPDEALAVSFESKGETRYVSNKQQKALPFTRAEALDAYEKNRGESNCRIVAYADVPPQRQVKP